MKKLLLAFLLTATVKTGNTQVIIALLFGDKLNSGNLEFGLMVSPTLTNITNIDANLRPGIDFGLYFNMKLNDRFYFHPEAIPKLAFGAKDIAPYSLGDANLDTLYANGSVNRTVKAIGLPLLMRYRIAGSFLVEAGPQIDLITNAKDVFKTKVNDNELSYENKTKDEYTRFDVGYALGIAYKILPGPRGMTIGLRYYGGLTDIMKNETGSQLNSAWLFNLYIPVGAGKAAAKHPAVTQ
jgi:hypothetical protein